MTVYSDKFKQEILECLLANWDSKDIGIKFNVSSSYIRKIARANGINTVIKDDAKWRRKKERVQPLKPSNQTFTDKYGITLDLEALEYFKEHTKTYFNPVLCPEKNMKDTRFYEVQYHITHGFINVSYMYRNVCETFKYKFINDFYKNKLTKENIKELIIKKNIFEKIVDNNNNSCVFDLDLFLNNVKYQEAINLANITKVAPIIHIINIKNGSNYKFKI